MQYIVKDLNGSRCLFSSVMTDFGDKPAVNFICDVGDDDDVRDKLTSMGVTPTAFTEYREFSNEEQKAEAVRAIVTAQHEIEYLEDWYESTLAATRQENACHWLALCT